MSVLKNKRSLSKLEFYHNARKLREDITNILLRDFGIKNKIHQTHTQENAEITVQESYPEWLVVYFRESIMGILKSMMLNITAGNTIYPTTMDELALRRRYQTGAIMNCEQLLQEMIYCADVLPVKMEKLLPYVNSIEFELKLLKGWRKSSNDLAKKIREEKK
ncbi:hypothetical protein AGMMS50268_24970 [Spirochaetia bacterium]|nr:hypothetical protein AGMMS50268_24970 [Spirochaetia bacterium]